MKSGIAIKTTVTYFGSNFWIILAFSHDRDRGCDYDYAFLETVVFGQFPFILPPYIIYKSFVFHHLLLESQNFRYFWILSSIPKVNRNESTLHMANQSYVYVLTLYRYIRFVKIKRTQLLFYKQKISIVSLIW